MERQEVDSSNIDAVGYDETTQTLEIEFRNGVYQYEDVPVSPKSSKTDRPPSHIKRKKRLLERIWRGYRQFRDDGVNPSSNDGKVLVLI